MIYSCSQRLKGTENKLDKLSFPIFWKRAEHPTDENRLGYPVHPSVIAASFLARRNIKFFFDKTTIRLDLLKILVAMNWYKRTESQEVCLQTIERSVLCWYVLIAPIYIGVFDKLCAKCSSSEYVQNAPCIKWVHFSYRCAVPFCIHPLSIFDFILEGKFWNLKATWAKYTYRRVQAAGVHN